MSDCKKELCMLAVDTTQFCGSTVDISRSYCESDFAYTVCIYTVVHVGLSSSSCTYVVYIVGLSVHSVQK